MKQGSPPRQRRPGSRFRPFLLLAPAARLVTPAIKWLAVRPFMLRRVSIDGLQFLVSVWDLSVSRGLLRDRTWEPVSTRLLQSQIRPGSTVVDIGAHLGYYTLLASRQVGPSGRVIAIEVDPSLAALLRRNVSLNGASNVEIVEAAVSDVTGWSRVRANIAAPRRMVPTVRLDDLLGNGDPVSVVKLDIDGGEAAALKGMSGLLASRPGLGLLIEYDPWQHEVRGSDAGDVLTACERLGLHLRDIVDEATGIVTHVDHPAPALGDRVLNLWLTNHADP